jgi:PAS domain S-box-containing protein
MALIGTRLILVQREQSSRQHRQQDEAAVALRKNTQILHKAQAVAHLASWTADLQTGIFEAASEGSHLIPWIAGTHTLADLLAMIHPDDQGYVRAAWQAAMRGAPYDIEYRVILNGEVRWLHIKAKITYDPQQNPIAALGIVQDITERKQTEIALHLSKELYHGLIASLDSAITAIDAEGRFHYLNDLAAAQLGGTPEALIGKTIAELFPEPVASTHLDYIRRVIRIDQKVVDEAQMEVQGRRTWYRTSMQPIHDATGGVIYVLINVTDINDMKMVQQELQEMNRTLEERVNQRSAEVQDLYENAPNGYHSLDANGTITMVNQTELTWLGYSRDELIGRRFTDLITAQSQILFQENFAGFRQRGWVRGLEYEFIRKDGTTLHTLLDATAIYDAHGTYLMSRSTMLDNTVRKQAEDALRESEAQNRLLFAESPDPIALFDAAGQVVQMNRAFELLTGYPSAQLTGRTLAALGMVSRAQMITFMAAVTQDTRANNEFFTTEFGLTSASGAVREVQARLFGLTIHGHPHYLTALHDITTEKQIEVILRHANAELARAAGAKDEFLANMSHELRTPPPRDPEP